MNPVAEALEELISLGVEGKALVAAIKRIETAAYDQRIRSLEEAVERATTQADAKRTRERDRKRAYRDGKAELSQGHDGTSGDVLDTPPLDKEKSPTPPKENNPPLTPTNTRARTAREMLAEAREAAGDALADMAVCPGVASLARLKALLIGEAPCDWEADVLPAITSAAAWHRKRDGKGSMTSWETAAKIAVQNRDARLTGAPAKPKDAKPAVQRDDDFWRAAVRRWRKDPSQWSASMGPRPSEDGCLVPEHVLQDTEQIRPAA